MLCSDCEGKWESYIDEHNGGLKGVRFRHEQGCEIGMTEKRWERARRAQQLRQAIEWMRPKL